MQKDLYSPKRAAIVVTIALLVSGVFVMAFLAGCATPDYTVVTIAEHPDDDISAAVTGGNRDRSDSSGGGSGSTIEPSDEIGGGGSGGSGGKSRCK